MGGLQQHEGDEKPGASAFVLMITSLQLLVGGSVSLVNKSSKEVNCAGSLHHKPQQVKGITGVKAFQTEEKLQNTRKKITSLK